MVGELRLATLNVLHGRRTFPDKRWPLILDELDRVGPDVVAFQEIARETNQDLAIGRASRRPYRAIRAAEVSRNDWTSHWDGLSLLFDPAVGRIREHRATFLAQGRMAHGLDLERRDGSRWIIANTHLPYGTGDRALARRARAGEHIVRWLHGWGPSDVVAVVGDFNAQPDEPVCEVMRDAGFCSAIVAMLGSDQPTYPTGLRAPGIEPEPEVVVDYIWVRGARVRTAALAWTEPADGEAALYASDHRGLVADLVPASR